METCVCCGLAMHERGGPAQYSVDLDMGDQYTGGGNQARVRICHTCGHEKLQDVLRLAQLQFKANAEAMAKGNR